MVALQVAALEDERGDQVDVDVAPAASEIVKNVQTRGEMSPGSASISSGLRKAWALIQ